MTVPILDTATFQVVASSGTTMSYRWYKDGNKIGGATSSTYTIDKAQTTDQGAYSVEVDNAGGSVTSSNATLTVIVPPGITTQPQSQAVARGQNVSFSVVANGSAPFSYHWNLDGAAVSGATNASLSLTNVQTTQAGSYKVVVTNMAGSVTSAVAALTVVVPPGITTQPQSQAVARGQNVSFSVVANGTAPFSYQWNFDGAAVSGATNASLSLTNVQTTQAGSYKVVVTNMAGSVTSAVAALTVIVPPGITTQPQSQAVAKGQNVSFSVVANGSAPFSYHWNFDGAAVSGATNASLTLTNVQTTQAGSYKVVVTNMAGSVTSAVAALTVNIPPGITTQPQSQAVARGQNVSFSVVANGSAPLSYKWRFDGAHVAGATNASLTLTNVQTTQAGSYKVVVTNMAGWTTSAVATLTVTNPVFTLSPPGGGWRFSNGFALQFSVPVGLTCVIQASTDLQTWTPVATNVVAAGSVLFTDTVATSYPNRFYRVIVP
jgi:uncharacterized protein YpmS